MSKIYTHFILWLLCLSVTSLMAQLRINEASNSNLTQIVDDDNEYEDWIEIYNAGNSAVNLAGYGLSDDTSKLWKWVFPPTLLQPDSFIVVFASGKNKGTYVHHYETAIYAGVPWKYVIPDSINNDTTLYTNWRNVNYNDNTWSSGLCSIGYGDNDDSTTIPNPTTSIYLRKYFSITDTSAISKALLHIDYDDGFVAYLNGIEIARAGLTGTPPNWNEYAADHEAQVYAGGAYERFMIDYVTLKSAMKNGSNVLAIELHNFTNNSSDLTILPYLSFGIKNPTLYFGGTTPNWFSEPTQSILHTNFTIKPTGEKIFLSDSISLLNQMMIPDIDPDMSFGLLPNGSSNSVYFLAATPRASNNNSMGYTGYEPVPTFALMGGFYPTSQTVMLINNSVTGGVIHYTRDGEIPTINDSIYTSPLTVDSTQVIKARCFPTLATMLPSKDATQTYMIMDTFTLPVISITTDSINLYGGNGIFDNYDSDWRKPCVYEYFDANGLKQLDTHASIKMDGGAGGSRSLPQKSVTIESDNSYYGDGTVDYAFMDDKNYLKKFDAFYLRNGSNMHNVFPHKEAYMQRMFKTTNSYYIGYTPVIVYINGHYWGLYEMREKTNDSYYKYNYGADEDSLDMLSCSYFYGANVLRVLEGSDTGFYNMHQYITTQNPNNSTYFENCNKKLDLYNFTDYLVGENWFSNFDWLYNNMKISRMRSVDNKWRFCLQDLEIGLGEWGWWDSDLFTHLRDFSYNGEQNYYSEIWQALLLNTEFHDYFINRYADLMNTILQHKYYYPMGVKMRDQLLPELPRHFLRWTDTTATPLVQSMQGYNDYFDFLINDQFDLRTPKVREQIVDFFTLNKQVNVTLNVQPANAGYIKISTIIPDSLPWQGVYFDGVPVTITAIPNPGYTFQNWIPNSLIAATDLTQQSITYNITLDTSFTAVFGGIPTPAKIAVSEIMYNCDPSLNSGNWVELHNYGLQNLDISDWIIQSKANYNKFTVPTGTKLPANSFLVVCEDTVLFQQKHPMVSNHIGALPFGLSNSFDSVKIYNPFQQLITVATYKDSKPYPECADGWGRTLEHTADTASYAANNWFCGCMNGSPGIAYAPCDDKIVISEINYNNSLPLVDAGDWIELKNNSNQAFNLGGMAISDNQDANKFVLPNAVLNIGTRQVLYQDLTKFNSQHPGISNKSGPFVFNLSGGGDVIRLYDANGILQYSMIYDDSNPWTKKPDTANYTLELIDTLGYKNPNNGTSWFAGCLGGSPGLAYTPCIISDIGTYGLQNIDVQVYPNPTNSTLWIEIDNPKQEIWVFSLIVMDVNGRILQNSTNAIEEHYKKAWDFSSFASGMYFLTIQSPKGEKHLSFVKE